MIAATAGHIDHGKTALVRALTGMETDRLEEEKRRGITIELGFAFLGRNVTLIDVPGHERFIKTMVAGVSTVDLGLLVVAADDGVMPQTREHLDILRLLGVPRLFAVLTKVDGLEPDWVGMIEEEVRELLPDEYRAATPFFRCDALSGEGVEALKTALLALADRLPPRRDRGVFRLPVDRVFSVKGYGTVVTGTILGGSVRAGDRLRVMPGVREVRVRGMQSHGVDRDSLGAGDRAALNLGGLEAGDLGRGDWLCEPEAVLPSERLDVALDVLEHAPPVKHRDRVHFHLGTGEILGRILLLRDEAALPGRRTVAQVRLEGPVAAARGDRFVIRRYSPPETLGGGEVLDPLPEERRRGDLPETSELAALASAADLEALAWKVRRMGTAGLPWDQARAFAGLPVAGLDGVVGQLEARGEILRLGSAAGMILFSREALERAREAIRTRLDDFHHRFPDQLGLTRARLLSDLAAVFPPALLERALDDRASGEPVLEKGVLRRAGHRIHLEADTAARADRVETLLREAGLAPPGLEALARQAGLTEADLVRLLGVMQAQDRVVRQEDFYWAAEAVDRAWEIVRRELAAGAGRTTSDLREALGCPRRHAVALLEHFDRLGRTQRREDFRFPGPEFAASASHIEAKNP